MKKRKVVTKRYPRRSTLIAAGIILIIISSIVFYYIDTMVPVNSSELILGVPENHYVKIVNGPNNEPMFAVQSSKVSKTAPGIGNTQPHIIVEKDSLVSIHLINEIKNTKDQKSQHNFNIDEFNVHSDTLGYFQTDIITFVADKTGTFEYYCSIHPELNGKIIVE